MSSLPVAAVLPELAIRPAACAAGFAQRADRRREVDLAAAADLAEGNIAGRIILLEPRRLAARKQCAAAG